MLEDLIAEATKRGLRVNNLFQLADLSWQANLTDGELYWDFGRGESAQEALQAALNKQLTTRPGYGIKPPERRPPTRVAGAISTIPIGSI